MKKDTSLIIIIILIFSSLISGCTQDNGNNGKIEEIELLSSEGKTYGNLSNGFIEVTGSLKNIGNRTINPVVIEVIFHNKDNVILYSGTYTIYNFVNGSTEYFFVQFRSTEPNYKDYHHYSIKFYYD